MFVNRTFILFGVISVSFCSCEMLDFKLPTCESCDVDLLRKIRDLHCCRDDVIVLYDKDGKIHVVERYDREDCIVSNHN